jgi:hypothetical protein
MCYTWQYPCQAKHPRFLACLRRFANTERVSARLKLEETLLKISLRIVQDLVALSYQRSRGDSRSRLPTRRLIPQLSRQKREVVERFMNRGCLSVVDRQRLSVYGGFDRLS